MCCRGKSEENDCIVDSTYSINLTRKLYIQLTQWQLISPALSRDIAPQSENYGFYPTD